MTSFIGSRTDSEYLRAETLSTWWA